ncbi:zf-C2HC5 domain-containing protein [Psidium guajava]|nr:zf-C2HC5 domain-containing protein [Psidium guajava]
MLHIYTDIWNQHLSRQAQPLETISVEEAELQQQHAHFQRGEGGDVEIGSVHLQGQETGRRRDLGGGEMEKIVGGE